MAGEPEAQKKEPSGMVDKIKAIHAVYMQKMRDIHKRQSVLFQKLLKKKEEKDAEDILKDIQEGK